MDKIIKEIGKRFVLSDITSDHGYFVTCNRKDTVNILAYLKEFKGFSHLVLITAVDWIEEDIFQLTYLLNNPEIKMNLGVRTFIKKECLAGRIGDADSPPPLAGSQNLSEGASRDVRNRFSRQPGDKRSSDHGVLGRYSSLPERDFDTKKYSEETYFPREGRGSNDPSEYMKEKTLPG